MNKEEIGKIKVNILTRKKEEATLIGIDIEAKKVEIIINGKAKIVSFTTAADYKTEEGQNLNLKTLTSILKEAESKEENKEVIEIEVKEPKIEKTPKEEKAPKEERIPQGNIMTNTEAVNKDNHNLVGVKDLSLITGIKEKALRKRLRKMLANDVITVKTSHTWLWDKTTIEWQHLIDVINESTDKE